jgi:hypothetical protein
MKKPTETAHTTMDNRSKFAYCGKLGHVEENCFKKQRDTSKEDKENSKKLLKISLLLLAKTNIIVFYPRLLLLLELALILL